MTNWNDFRIRDIVAKKPNAIAMGPFGSRITKDNFVETGVPVIRGINISKGRFYPHDFVYLTETKADELKASNAYPNDLVFTHRGTLGQVGIIPNNLYPRYVVSQSQMKLTCNPGKAWPQFMFYYFLAIGNKALLTHTSGSGVPAIAQPSTSLRNLKIRIPPLPIQKKIAAILTAYDDLIENNNMRIALLEKAAEEIYREWFVRMRFPGWQQTKFEKGVPDGWTVLHLRDVAKFNLNSIKKGQTPEFINYIDIASVTTHRIINITKLQFSKAPGRARRIVKSGDIIWSTVRPANRAFCLILHPPENLVVSTGFAVLTPKRNIPYSFLYFAVTRDEFVEYIANVSKGAAYPAADIEDFKKALLLVPDTNTLKRFHLLTEPFLIQRQTLFEQNDKLKTSRNMLLTRLISGKLQVDNLDIHFPPGMAADTYERRNQ